MNYLKVVDKKDMAIKETNTIKENVNAFHQENKKLDRPHQLRDSGYKKRIPII